MENLNLAVDQHPVSSKGAPARTKTSEMVPFGSKSLILSMYKDVAEDLHVFDRIT